MPTPDQLYTQADGRTEPLPGLREMMSGAPPKPPKKRVHRTGLPTLSIGNRPLTKKQIIVLAQLAKTAWEIQSKHGLVDPGETAAAWRRRQRLEAIGTADISETRQRHYRRLRGTFKSLAGDQSPEVLADLTEDPDGTDRDALATLIRAELRRLSDLDDNQGKLWGEHRAEAYLLRIAQDKRFGLAPVDLRQVFSTWPPHRLEQLLYTLRNRIAAFRQTGCTAARNKSQRGR